MSIESGDVITVGEAAAIAGKAATVIHRWTEVGFRGVVLPHTRFGKSKVIRLADLCEFLKAYRAVEDGRKSRSA